MLEQNIGQYLGKIKSIFYQYTNLNLIKGIPSDADLSQLEDHWQKCHEAKPHAMTILTKLFRNMDEVSQK